MTTYTRESITRAYQDDPTGTMAMVAALPAEEQHTYVRWLTEHINAGHPALEGIPQEIPPERSIPLPRVRRELGPAARAWLDAPRRPRLRVLSPLPAVAALTDHPQGEKDEADFSGILAEVG